MTQQEFKNLKFGDIINDGTCDALMINDTQYIWRGNSDIRELMNYSLFNVGPMPEPEPEPLTVGTLKKILDQHPDDMYIVYGCRSEQVLMMSDQVNTADLGQARNDNWVHNYRPDKPTQEYLVFPGN